MHTQHFGFSSIQLWRSRDFCISRIKYAERWLVTTLERTKFCSYCVGLTLSPTRRRGLVVSISACHSCDVPSILRSAAFFCLPFFLRGLVPPRPQIRLQTPALNVFSVAEGLALLRYQWWCLDRVRGLYFKSAIKCRGQPRKIAEILEIWRMANTSLATEPLRRYSNSPKIWRVARMEVVLQIPYPERSGKLRGG